MRSFTDDSPQALPVRIGELWRALHMYDMIIDRRADADEAMALLRDAVKSALIDLSAFLDGDPLCLDWVPQGGAGVLVWAHKSTDPKVLQVLLTPFPADLHAALADDGALQAFLDGVDLHGERELRLDLDMLGDLRPGRRALSCGATSVRQSGLCYEHTKCGDARQQTACHSRGPATPMFVPDDCPPFLPVTIGELWQSLKLYKAVQEWVRRGEAREAPYDHASLLLHAVRGAYYHIKVHLDCRPMCLDTWDDDGVLVWAYSGRYDALEVLLVPFPVNFHSAMAQDQVLQAFLQDAEMHFEEWHMDYRVLQSLRPGRHALSRGAKRVRVRHVRQQAHYCAEGYAISGLPADVDAGGEGA